MALLRWDPWADLAALQRDVNELMGRPTPAARANTALIPPIDAYRTGEGLVVRVELPGMRSEDVDVSVHDGMLTISGERKLEAGVSEEDWLRRERAVGRFERSFTLPKGTDAAQITANFENGVLELRVPHPPERKPRKIEVGGSQQGQAVGVDSGQERNTVDVSEREGANA